MVHALENAGFELTHVRGSHHYLRLPHTAGLLLVPVHENHDLPTGTLRAILRQADLTPDELTKLL